MAAVDFGRKEEEEEAPDSTILSSRLSEMSRQTIFPFDLRVSRGDGGSPIFFLGVCDNFSDPTYVPTPHLLIRHVLFAEPVGSFPPPPPPFLI